jgi:RecJ-like exonuclease
MSLECPSCHGKGFIIKGEKPCDNCSGTGRVKSVNLVGMTENDLKSLLSGGFCPKCKGGGKIQIRESCQACGGSGKAPVCEVCGKAVDPGQELCGDCRNVRPVYRLSAACDVSDLDAGKTYAGKVANLADFGVFVTLNDRTKGLIH